jgi:hypothetical protein
VAEMAFRTKQVFLDCRLARPAIARWFRHACGSARAPGEMWVGGVRRVPERGDEVDCHERDDGRRRQWRRRGLACVTVT